MDVSDQELTVALTQPAFAPTSSSRQPGPRTSTEDSATQAPT